MAAPRGAANLTDAVPTSLVRNLGLFGAIAVSLAVVGPSMSVSLNPQAMAEQVGGAVPLVYVMALVPIATIAIAFIVLTRRHGTAGSLYTLVGLELGPRAPRQPHSPRGRGHCAHRVLLLALPVAERLGARRTGRRGHDRGRHGGARPCAQRTCGGTKGGFVTVKRA
ncbi:MAG: hypothetical protein WEA35_01030 [Candidatus Nanopelagicales bacterium]